MTLPLRLHFPDIRFPSVRRHGVRSYLMVAHHLHYWPSKPLELVEAGAWPTPSVRLIIQYSNALCEVKSALEYMDTLFRYWTPPPCAHCAAIAIPLYILVEQEPKVRGE